MLEARCLALQRPQILEEDEIVSFVLSPCSCFMEEAKELPPTNLASYQATSRTRSQEFPFSEASLYTETSLEILTSHLDLILFSCYL